MKIPLNPPFSKGDNYSSLSQREVGRDLRETLTTPFGSGDFRSSVLSNKNSTR